MSPVSYWDPQYFDRYAVVVEMGIGLVFVGALMLTLRSLEWLVSGTIGARSLRRHARLNVEVLDITLCSA